jgi:hypothetical protein
VLRNFLVRVSAVDRDFPDLGRCVLVGNYPSPLPWSTGMMELGENLEVIYGAQSLAGKILVSKSLWLPTRDSLPRFGTEVRSAHLRVLADDGVSRLCKARLDVTKPGCGKVVGPRYTGAGLKSGAGSAALPRAAVLT